METKMRIKYIIIAILFVLPAISYSQFGKNKVQYQTFNWKYISSKNFDVYYTEGSKYIAEFTAIEAERAIVQIGKVIKYSINKRIPIIVYNTKNEFQQTNIINQYLSEGILGVTEMLKNRVVLPFMGDYNQYKHVIHHELVHAVLNQYLYGGSFQTAVQVGQDIQFPLWMNEGLAEYISIGGIDTENDMFIRDFVISEKLKGLEYLSGYLAYRGGQTFYWYVAEKYGESKISDLLSKIRRGYQLDVVFKESFGMDLKDFSEQWVKDLKKYYWPDIEKYKAPQDFSQRITNHKKEESFYNSSPTISPDGEKIAYISDADGLYAIYIRNIEGKDKPRKIISSYRAQDFEELNLLTPGITWSPDGKQIAISAKAGGEDAIYIYNLKNESYEKMTFGLKAISSVSWSPDGANLCFVASSIEKSDIYLYNFKTKKHTKITDDVYTESVPIWSPDSKKIYFISNRADDLVYNDSFKIWKKDFSYLDIYSIELSTKNIERLSFDPENSKTSIAATADSKHILYISDKNGIGNIYDLDLTTLKTRPLTNSLTGLTQLSINNDGSRLAFATMNEGGIDAFMIKYPLEKVIPGDTLPLTKLKETLTNKNFPQLSATDYEKASSYKPDEIKYGNYKIDFTRQKFVKSNPDAVKKSVEVPTNEEINENFVERDYKVNFSVDAVMGNPGYSTYYGFAGNAVALFSDIMGEHQIYIEANILTDLNNSNLMATYVYLPKIIDYQFTVFHNAAYWYLNGFYYRFRNWGASITSSYAFDRFNRVELGLNWYNAYKENVETSLDPTISRTLIVPEAKFVHDDVLWGWFAPNRGTRALFEVKAAPKISNGGLNFMITNADVRHYITIFDYITFALRGKVGVSFGANPRKYYLGGTDNWFNYQYDGNYMPIEQPEDFIFMQYETPLRGWNLNSVSGSKMFLGNFEMRFPLFQALVAGPVPILLQGVMGSFFFDVGGAWNGDFADFKPTQFLENGNKAVKDLRTSAGIGVRSYLFGLPFKLDISWRNEITAWSKPWYLFSLGYDF
jgi:Tol biopolymer transport system component